MKASTPEARCDAERQVALKEKSWSQVTDRISNSNEANYPHASEHLAVGIDDIGSSPPAGELQALLSIVGYKALQLHSPFAVNLRHRLGVLAVFLPPVRQLQYLVALHDHLHFGRAAQALNVTQSTLSSGIRELERFLDVQLVERTNKSVAFTELGLRIADRSRYIIMQVEDLMEEAQAFHNPLSLPIKIGGIHTIAPYVMGHYAATLREAFPSLQLYLREDTTAGLVAELLANQLDLALIALPYDAGSLETITIYREPLHLAFCEGSSIVEDGLINFDDLPDESLLLLDDGHCLRDHALAGCRLKSHKKIHTFGANSLQMLVQMVQNDVGVTILPQMALDAGILNGTPIKTEALPLDRFHRDIGFAWRRGHSRADALMTLIDCFRDAIPTQS